MGLALWTKGDLETAHWMFAEGMAQLQMAGNISDAVGGVLALSDIRIAQGHLRDAMHTYERALQLARENGTSMLRGTADMYVGMSELEREHNDLQAAMQLLLRSQEQGEHTGFPQHPYRWRVAMARIREAQGVLNGALELLQEAEPLYVSDFFPNVHPISALKARLWIAQGRLAEALSWPRQARSKRSLTGATHSKRWSRRTAMSPRDTNRATSSSLWSRRMSSQHNPDRDTGSPSVYQIRIRGHLGPQWRNWFDGLAITLEENGDTLLTGRVMDQAALHGLLKKVRDLGIPLLSVNTVDPNQADIGEFDQGNER
jgi:ATP/maltotriose-dependent transcriptional regulator MalT